MPQVVEAESQTDLLARAYERLVQRVAAQRGAITADEQALFAGVLVKGRRWRGGARKYPCPSASGLRSLRSRNALASSAGIVPTLRSLMRHGIHLRVACPTV
jgi:hypothetical protein